MYRIEKDFIGELKIPQKAYYGIHSVRAAENFRVSNNGVHSELIKALALVKQAAADANMTVGLLDRKIGDAVYQAAGEIAAGNYQDQFIVDALQGGAGTSTNMNMNEVIANRAIELLGGKKGDYSLVHPINHVNMSQSTNDVYPTALRIAAIRMLQPLSESCALLQGAFQKKEAEFAGVLKVGRTEMQDAVPVSLGQEFAAYAEALSRDRWRLYKVEERLRQINIGGTAVGTGLNADREYIYTVVERLRGLTGIGLARAENMIDVTQNADVFVEVSGLLKANAATLAKIAADLRILSSGPRAGFAEINLPNLQAGSSIMPGKINPVMPEMITQAVYQVMAHDVAITLAAQAGQLELNAFLPLIAANILPAIELLDRAMRLFAERCILGITANKERCREMLDGSIGLAAVLVPHIGYEKAAEIAQTALLEGKSIRQVILENKIMTAEETEAVLQPEAAVKAGITGR